MTTPAMKRASRSVVRQVSGGRFLCDVNARNPLLAKIRGNKKHSKVIFCATSTHETNFLFFRRFSTCSKTRDVNARNPLFLKFSLCCLLFCFCSPAGARHRPPGHAISPSFSPLRAPSWGSRVPLFVRRQRGFGTSSRNRLASSSGHCFVLFCCRSPFLHDVNALSPNSRPNSRRKRESQRPIWGPCWGHFGAIRPQVQVQVLV